VRFGRPKGAGATPDAIEVLYRARYRAFLKVAAGVAGERNAADAVHNAFLHALRGRSSFRGDSSLETWLWRTVINAAHDLRDLERDVSPREEPPFEPLHTQQDVRGDEFVREVILALPTQQKLTLFLRYYADLDYRAIAAILEVTPGTVGAALHNAHAAVRQRLQEAV